MFNASHQPQAFVPPLIDDEHWRLLISTIDGAPLQADAEGHWKLPDRAIVVLSSRRNRHSDTDA
jgi:glycogen operon protein